MSVEMSESEQNQPLLPRIGMIWYFIVVVVVAIMLFVIRAAEQGQALAAAMAFTGLFLFVVALISGGCFVVAFLFGAMEKAFDSGREEPASPFIVDGSLPEQLVPPKPSDDA